MGLRERWTQVTQFFETARTKGRQLMDEDERRAASAEKQVSQREDRRLGGMTTEDRERHARSPEPTIAADE
jgi:hypothetical protein